VQAEQTYDIGDTVVLQGVYLTKPTTGSVNAGSTALTVKDATGYTNGDPIFIEGAAAEDGDLYTTVSSISGNTITLAAAAATQVISARVGKLTAPGAATCKVRLPDGTSSSPATSLISTGRYQASYDPTLAGQHWYRFDGTTTAKGSGERSFLVAEKRVT
jgi:hypothetical protein